VGSEDGHIYWLNLELNDLKELKEDPEMKSIT